MQNVVSSAIENALLMRVLRGEKVSRPPVWMMRQAGRFLPDYMKLRAKYSFFERVQTPELATEITVMPVHQVGVDAAIIFSDILVIPQALDFIVTIKPGEGPRLPRTVQTEQDVDNIVVSDIEDRLHYVMEALTLTRKTLPENIPLIGFAGAPWTLLCYMVEGRGSKTFDKAKAFCFSQPKAAHKLLQKITDATILYLKAQLAAGANLLQLFDSWGGLLAPDDFELFSMPYINQIVDAVAPDPLIVFAKGCGHAYPKFAQSGVQALGVDWGIRPEEARRLAGPDMILQGNFDPARLLGPIPEIERLTKEMLEAFGTQQHIANLGHGILPNVPVDHAKAFINTIKNFG